jgi:transposase
MRSPSPQQRLPEQPSQTDFRRNQAEQDLRMLKVQQKIAGSFRAESGSEAFARIRGYCASLRKQGVGLLAALQTVFAGQPLYPDFA